MTGQTGEIREEHGQRMAWWREAKFGMFIHWGLYAVLAGMWKGEKVPGIGEWIMYRARIPGMWKGEKVPGIGEWIMYRARIPVNEYEPLARRFNPVKFNAREWVRVARDAGMKWMVITAKHHDGFCILHV